jgi:peptidoglycan/xylan/chitin deacetylase (PgdA/CDA1 family)
MQRFGRFVSLDEAVVMLESERPTDGLTFCVTFDDGYRNSLTNALPVLDLLGIPATFYVITDLVGTTVAEHRPALERHFAGGAIVEFLDWDACRDLARAGMAIGSHTSSHADLARCDEAGAWAELTGSKALIEAQLGGRCDHFCAPFGIAGVNFDATRHPALAAEAGYRSFATGRRGPMHAGDSPFALRRDQLLANWGTSQVRYLLGR